MKKITPDLTIGGILTIGIIYGSIYGSLSDSFYLSLFYFMFLAFPLVLSYIFRIIPGRLKWYYGLMAGIIISYGSFYLFPEGTIDFGIGSVVYVYFFIGAYFSIGLIGFIIDMIKKKK